MSTAKVLPRVLIVVPTLGQRLDYLEQTLSSIRSQPVPADIVVVTPATATRAREITEKFGAEVVDDPGSLPSAINLGAASLLPHHEFINWLGDDDLLEPESLMVTTQVLDATTDAVVAYGSCRYIDGDGRELWVNSAGPWAARVLSWGPQLIPQPGMLIRASAWTAVGGVDETFRFAFDFDLLLKLRKLGRLIDTGSVVSSFRWHSESLTVGDRSANLAESELAKRRYLTPTQKRLKWMWEKPVRVATRVAANEVSRRARKASS